jgi:glycosyltransferase involved in cell wall biosynthesis
MIIIYGLGKKYNTYKNAICEAFHDDQIVYSDKNWKSLTSQLDVEVISPKDAVELDYEYIAVTAADFESIKSDLLALKADIAKIVRIQDLIAIKMQGKSKYFPAEMHNKNKKILIFNGNLGFHGSTMACYFTACALKKCGYYVEIGCGSADDRVIRMINESGIPVIILLSYPRVGGEDINIIKKYDLIISNTITTINFVHYAYQFVSVIWWIHEASDNRYATYYRDALSISRDYSDQKWLDNIKVLSVSRRAERVFKDYFGKNSTVVPIGIPDDFKGNRRNSGKITVANIGYFREDKNQLQFVEAAERINKTDIKFILIGAKVCSDEYYNKILKIINSNENIEIVDELNRNQIQDKYEEIDIVVCSSYIESLSMTIIEGMMHSKVVITTDGTGISDYIKDGVNGFVCKAGDLNSLKTKMEYAILHFNELDDMRKEARETYMKYFSLQELEKKINSEFFIG